MKVQELAEKQELTAKEVLGILSTIGIKNKRSTSNLKKDELEKFNTYLSEQEDKRPEIALIKKKDKEGQEEHKKIVIKKKKVIIVKKHPKTEEKKKEAAAASVATKETAKPETKKKAAPKKKAETVAVEDKTATRKTKGKPGEKEKKEKEAPKKYIRKRHGHRRYERKKEDEQEHLDKLFQHRKKDRPVVTSSPIPKEIEILETISVGELARKMNLKANELITKLISLGVMARINDQIDSETATLVAAEYDCNTKVISLYEETVIEDEEDSAEDLLPRPPVVTVMGHVDHGKTKLLDAIRNTDVVQTESGGITQHIGAYKVSIKDREIVFLDTPGHEAFTMMRARGAKVTDIVVLVVAADDGVMPQTIEAIDHAKEANVPIVVAVNKIDLADANPDKVKTELSEHGIISEEWGGESLMIEVSALKKKGIDKLLEAIALQAEMLELKANPNRRAQGSIIESKIDKGRGIVATVLIDKGTLTMGEPFVAGVFPGKVRAMFDEHGEQVKAALPADPIEVIGFSGLPIAGDPFQVTENEKFAKQIGQKRQELKRFEASRNVKKVTLENLYDQIKEGELLELKVIIKADVQGVRGGSGRCPG